VPLTIFYIKTKVALLTTEEDKPDGTSFQIYFPSRNNNSIIINTHNGSSTASTMWYTDEYLRLV
jgi:hypothetical protein